MSRRYSRGRDGEGSSDAEPRGDLRHLRLDGHGRLETEAAFVSLAESQLALAALASLCAGEGTQ